jgi:hypothetical protein
MTNYCYGWILHISEDELYNHQNVQKLVSCDHIYYYDPNFKFCPYCGIKIEFRNEVIKTKKREYLFLEENGFKLSYINSSETDKSMLVLINEEYNNEFYNNLKNQGNIDIMNLLECHDNVRAFLNKLYSDYTKHTLYIKLLDDESELTRFKKDKLVSSPEPSKKD